MYVIGTAGHVDHGKSTLVRALTGIDPDRLKEEKEREMTIDLGFAWLDPGGEEDEIGIVDVPGHRDFIENMLAGVGSIDLALLVVAADEGVMPQTAEHLAILDLLQVPGGVVALAKTDLVREPDWLDLVKLDLIEHLQGTVLEKAPIVPVSAHSGEGLERLRTTLLAELRKRTPQADEGRPRLPVDRTFSLQGFGTIVTGTLSGGRFELGDTIEIQPQGLSGRIRGLQTHQTKLATAQPGSRVAVNLTGVSQDEISRGDVVAHPGIVGSTVLCDAQYLHLPTANAPLKHNREMKLFVGAKEVMARTRVLGKRQIDPGHDGWIQLALAEPVAMSPGDRFILRTPSPPATVGGGRILDPFPGRRHRRFRPDTVGRLKTLAEGSPTKVLLQFVQRKEPTTKEAAIAKSMLPSASAENAWEELLGSDDLVRFDHLYLSRRQFDRYVASLTALLQGFHQEYPLRDGMARAEVRSRLNIPGELFSRFLEHLQTEGAIDSAGAIVRLSSHKVEFSDEQQSTIDRLIDDLEQAGVNSPNVSEVSARIGDELYFALIRRGDLIQVSDDVVYSKELYEKLEASIKEHLAKHGRVNAAEVRDLLNTSRKYAIGILEYLDDQGVTRRVGDERELASQVGGNIE